MSKINSCHQIKKGITPAKGFIVSSNTWGILTLLYCLILSIRASKTYDVVKHPECYILGICIFKAADCLVASILWLRSSHRLQMASDRLIWLLVEVGIVIYFLGRNISYD